MWKWQFKTHQKVFQFMGKMSLHKAQVTRFKGKSRGVLHRCNEKPFSFPNVLAKSGASGGIASTS
jgi:hypothetical protein